MINMWEQGDVFFVYRPQVEQEHIADLAEVQRLYMILNPDRRDVYRRLVIGRKRLAEPQQRGRQRHWASPRNPVSCARRRCCRVPR